MIHLSDTSGARLLRRLCFLLPALCLPTIIALLSAPDLAAQQAPLRDSTAVDTVSTVEERPTFQPQLTPRDSDMLPFSTGEDSTEAAVTPEGAVWRSLALPGWGQYYVEDYWKAPVVLGAAGWFTFQIFRNNSKFNDAKDAIALLPEDDPDLFVLRREREFYRDKRDEAGLYLALTYLIATIDAYVGAHLYYFDVTDDLDGQLYFDPRTYGPGLRLRF